MQSTVKEILPLIPIRGITIFPYMVVHFDLGREKSIKALEEAMATNQRIFIALQKDPNIDYPEKNDLYEYGVVCKVKQMLKLPGDKIRVLVEGVSRARVQHFEFDDPYMSVEIIKYADDSLAYDREHEALKRWVLDTFARYVQLNPRITPDVLISIKEISDYGRLSDVIASHMGLKHDQKQIIIETIDTKLRLEILYKFLLNEVDISEAEKRINEKVKAQINKTQKDYYLKEQIKAIREEIGEDNSKDEEIEEFKEKAENLEASDKIKEKLFKEINKLELLSQSSPESNVIRNYVSNILELPWGKSTEDSLDLSNSRKILNEDHYALDDVKERVLEFLAVKKLTNSMKGPIICLVGPPGVGKTSIARSVARSLNRKFIRMSLGGVRDEAEIRGHRRTYIGAIPGRIMTSIKEVGSNNPVFLFDEIDKLGNDFRGDPASALLEVLDPEQNKEFTDRYLEVPFDLSNVMFITTANTLSTIPRPLFDRMEIIEVSGYTEEEKLQIAKRYLVEKQREAHGIKKSQYSLKEDALRFVISSYTRESGVRELERKIAKLFRKAALDIVEEKAKKINMSKKRVREYLGKEIYSFDEIGKKSEVGVVRGLAWTAVGGTTLNVEVTKLQGKGQLVLTGRLGDVMKESARAGLTYIRSISKKYKLEDDFHEKIDIHIHVPEGATPKDGPSAGITMATAILSAITGIPVKHDIAMTGEITLRGRVLPIGGLKEKTLAAERAGVKTVLFPYENKKDLEDIPESVKENVEMIPVKTMKEVLKYALDED